MVCQEDFLLKIFSHLKKALPAKKMHGDIL